MGVLGARALAARALAGCGGARGVVAELARGAGEHFGYAGASGVIGGVKEDRMGPSHIVIALVALLPMLSHAAEAYGKYCGMKHPD